MEGPRRSGADQSNMFGADVASEWCEGSPITWTGEWEGKPYEDKGTILRFEPISVLSYSHYSPLTGEPDVPESYHTVTIALHGDGAWTRVDLAQDNKATEEARDHSQQNWETMLDGLKKVVESEKPET